MLIGDVGCFDGFDVGGGGKLEFLGVVRIVLLAVWPYRLAQRCVEGFTSTHG